MLACQGSLCYSSRCPLQRTCSFFIGTGFAQEVVSSLPGSIAPQHTPSGWSCREGRAITIKKRLILSTLIVYGVAAATELVTIPSVAVDLYPDLVAQTALAREPELAAAPSTPKPTTQERVRTYFKDLPVMAEIARCESHFKQVDQATGDVIRGRVNANDLGVMQINETYHARTARALGLDLYSLEGNLAYARYLYEREGTAPWNASRHCWAPGTLAAR